MKEISDYLKEKNIKALSYKKNGKVTIIDTNIGKIVLKNGNDKNYIVEYLDTRSFNYYPEIISNDKYFITKFINEIDIPKEKKISDLVDLVALLHSKTTFYKEISEDEYKKIYEDLENNFEYLYEYYMDEISMIDEKIFPSPSEYLFSINFSLFLTSIESDKKSTQNWLKSVQKLNKIRMSVVHNNLNLSHFIENKKGYLISWDKSKIDFPIFDLYILYNNHFDEFDFYDLLKRYEKIYPLKDYELDLFFILINMPLKLEFNGTEYDKCYKLTREINRLYKSHNLFEEYKKSI